MINKLITIRQAAKTLGISIDTLRRWDKSGKLLSVRAGKGSHRLYKESDLDVFVNNPIQRAEEWALSRIPKEPPENFFCQNSAIFQARLSKMESDLSKIKDLEDSFPLLVAVAGEIGGNSFDHNIGSWPDIMGAFFAYDTNRRLIVLADRGQGILTTLKRTKPSLKTHAEALETAFTEIISGRAPESRGNGLKFVKKVISGNSFALDFQTGNAKLEIGPFGSAASISKRKDFIQGCLAIIRF